MSLIKKITTAAKYYKTYQVGLLQTKAYRVLKHHTARVLSEFDISTIEWAFLGLLYDNPKGIRLNILATELGVEAPFITQITTRLKKTQYFEHREDPEDSRAKIILMTKEGKAFVDKAEKHLRAETKALFQDVSAADLLTYITVLDKVIHNSK
jgi:MarR family transcriptional regulator for hemolysin